MSDDPYDILGVSKDASKKDIRKAYRKLAKDLHPDLHPGDSAAEERFKKVSAAYHLLNDPERRARYDRGEIDATGAEQPQHQFYRQYAEADAGRYSAASGFEDFQGFSDIFSELFGGSGGTRQTVHIRGHDAHYQLQVGFMDAVKGAKRRITLPGGESLDLTIPAGTRDGAILRLKGKGGTGYGGGTAGDALVRINVKPHPVFKRDDDDIRLELPITLDEAVLGAKVEVPTIWGRVSMTVPKGAKSGDVLRLKGKGIKGRQGRAGDQYVILKIVTPDRIDEDLSKFMETWRKTHRYDPRSRLRTAT